jgi:hypothetical protein
MYQDPWVIELWSQARRSEKKNESFEYHFDALPGIEVPEDKVTFDFYRKYMKYVRFKKMPELFCVEAMKNFAVMFLLKGSVMEAFSVIEGDLFIHLSNPYRAVMEQFMGDGSYFFRHTNTEHHVEFIRRFARMCAIGMTEDDGLEEYRFSTVMQRLRFVGIIRKNFSNNLTTILAKVWVREMLEEQRRYVRMSEWLAATFF